MSVRKMKRDIRKVRAENQHSTGAQYRKATERCNRIFSPLHRVDESPSIFVNAYVTRQET